MKLFLLRLLKAAGVMWLFRYRYRNKILIFTLHGVMDEDEPTQWTPLRGQISRKTLDSGICELSKYYNFVSLDDAVLMIQGEKELVPYSVVVTFDDGYRNNITHALPILLRYKVPVTIFIATSYVGNNKLYWFDRLDYALQHSSADGKAVMIAGQTITIDASCRSALSRSYRKIRQLGKNAIRNDEEMIKEMDRLSEILENESGNKLLDIISNDPWVSILSWDEIKNALNCELVSFGSHTVDHSRLALIDEGEAFNQLTESKSEIEKNARVACRNFCYPIGSFSTSVSSLVDKAGYLSAVTTEKGFNSVGCNIQELCRLPFPDKKDSIEILALASGLTSKTSKYKKRLKRLLRK